MKETKAVTLSSGVALMCSVERKNATYELSDMLQIVIGRDGGYQFVPYQPFSPVQSIAPEHVISCADIEHKEMLDIHREFRSPIVTPDSDSMRHRPTIVQ